MNADERDDAGATLLFVKGCRKPNPIFFLQKYGFESMWITHPHSLSAVRAEREDGFFCIDLGAQDILQWGQKRCLREPNSRSQCLRESTGCGRRRTNRRKLASGLFFSHFILNPVRHPDGSTYLEYGGLMSD